MKSNSMAIWWGHDAFFWLETVTNIRLFVLQVWEILLLGKQAKNIPAALKCQVYYFARVCLRNANKDTAGFFFK